MDIFDNICPHCKKHILSNKKVFANHVRWCKQNPKYNEIRNSTINKLKKFYNKFHKSFEVKCYTCGKIFNVIEDERKFPLKDKYFCCRSCANTHIFSQETKDKISKSLKNRTKPHIKKCKNCGKEIISKRKFCSDTCQRIYKSRNSTNPHLKIYLSFCKFNFSLNQYTDEFDFELIEKYGWYKASNHGNNLNGISRDHKFSQLEGWEQKIDPYIISHPVNCELMQHYKNSSKNKKCSITLEELIKNIIIWNKKYGKFENKIDYTIFEKMGIKFSIKFDEI